MEGILQAALADPSAITIKAEGITGGMALYASLFWDQKVKLELSKLPKSHLEGPYYPKVMQYMDLSAALLLARDQHVFISR